MGGYLLRRLIGIPIVLFVLITLSFFLVRLAPGNPFSSERNLTPAIEKNLNEKYGLDKPMVVQYARYMGRVVQGDLGPSTKFKDRTVNDIISDHWRPTAVIGVGAIAVALLVGLVAGIIGAVRQNSFFDYASMSVAMFGMSVPQFVTGPVLVLFFALHWKWLPVSGYSAHFDWWPAGVLAGLYVVWRLVEWTRSGFPGSANFDRGREIGAFWIGLVVSCGVLATILLVRNDTLILPCIVLGLPFASRIARLMRAGMLEVIHQDYIRTARAKGLAETVVIARHAIKGGILPVVSYLGPAIAALLTGGLVVEKIFNVPGIAREFVESALNRDYSMVLGTVILYGTLLVFANLLVDIAYGFLDPRIRYE